MMSPEMMKAASDMMAKMSPEDIQRWVRRDRHMPAVTCDILLSRRPPIRGRAA
jgi:hypothetical protein